MLLAEHSIKQVTSITIILTAPSVAEDTEAPSEKYGDFPKFSGEWQRQQENPADPHGLVSSHPAAPASGWTFSTLFVAFCCNREF